ncbi:MaoC/PaaZ C-terminal domain-containing protein [Desulfococcaceae bacterium HSG8]|nr:MaoC/PaaZ C-terminal domain-containing protein [Desulfococcaceae bacterium HSG8]
MVKRYLEYLNERDLLQCNTVLFTRESIIDFARKFDPQPFHINEKLAEESIFGGLIASRMGAKKDDMRNICEPPCFGRLNNHNRRERTTSQRC